MAMADEWERTGETVEELRGSAADDGWERTGEVAPPAKPAKPKTAFDFMPSAVQQSQAIMGVVGQQISDPKSTTRFAADRAVNAAASVPGLPADILNIIAQHTPTVEDAAYLPFIGPAVAMERARIDREGADAMVPLGGENIRAAGQDLGVLPKPRAPEGIGEKWLGNVADFAGGSVAPFGFAKSLVPSLTGATTFTAAQELFPDSPLVQFLAALVGAGTPAGLETAARKGTTVVKPLIDPLTEAGQRTAAGRVMTEAGARPKPQAEWKTAATPGIELTAGQALDDESLLRLQKAHEAKVGAGDIFAPFNERLRESQTTIRQALEDLRGSGMPEEARVFAENQLREADRAMNQTLDLVTSPRMRAMGGAEGRALTSTEAQQRIAQVRQLAREEETRLWESGWAERGQVDVNDVQGIFDEWLSQQPRAYENKIPADVQAALARLMPEKDPILEGVEVIKHTPERITAAASRLGDETFQGANHADVIENIAKETGQSFDDVAGRVDKGDIVEGFVTSNGRFVTRSEAAKIAAAQNQLDETSKFPKGERIPLMTEAMKPYDEATSSLVPIREIAPLRTMLRENAQAARASGRPNDARIYGGLERRLGEYLDNLEFDDPDIQAGHQAARTFSAERASVFERVPELRALLGRDAQGGARVAPEQALTKLITPDAKGVGTVRRLLAVDDSPEMQGLVRDFLLSNMPEDAAKAAAYIERYGGVLSELPVVRGQLQQVADMRAAVEALQSSPLGNLSGMTPQKFISQMIAHPDAARMAEVLKQQLRNNPAAWNGMRAAYVDELIKRAERLGGETTTGQRPVLPTAIAKFNRDNAALNNIFLEPQGAQLLNEIEKSALISERTGRFAGSPTAPLQATEKFIDQLMQGLVFNRAPWLVQKGMGWLYGKSEERIRALLAQALLDPKLANDLMQEATAAGLKKVRPGTRTWLDSLKRNARVGLGTHAAQTSAAVAPPPPERVDNAIPEQPFGAEAIPLQPAPLASNDDEANEPGAWLAK